MKSTGIIREMDELGRIVIPKELRRTLSLEKGSHIEIFTNGNLICLQKAGESCIICGKEEGLLSFEDKHICRDCIASLSGL